MLHYALTLRAEAPLAMRSGSEAIHAESLTYIPGSSLWGALAAAHRLRYPKQDQEFGALFSDANLQIGNAYPSSFPDDTLMEDPSLPTLPLPTTARSCKRFHGFRADDPDHHGVSDHLVLWTVFALSGERETAPLEGQRTCAHAGCGQPMDRISGFYRRDPQARRMSKAEEGMVLFTRTGISRRLGTVREGILYSRQAFPKGRRFRAEVAVTEELAGRFLTCLHDFAQAGLLRVGTSRSRGFGRLGVEDPVSALDQPASSDALRQRVLSFDQTLRQVATEARVETPHHRYVPLTLTSDALLLDELLRWRTTLDGAALAGMGIENSTLVFASAGIRRHVGWNALLGLPTAQEVAIGMGSVFVFGCNFEPDYDRLLTLEHTGLGERQEKGFGRLRVADPFHLEGQGA